MADVSQFEETTGIQFNDRSLLEQAFTHRSYLNETSGSERYHNERLEFLGDAVLELAVTDHLYRKYPDTPEGDLTAYRSALVNTSMISDAARQLGMNEYLLLSKGEAKDTGKAREYILANTFEAVIGAIYIDQGFTVAEQFIASILFDRLDEVIEKKLYKDAKSLIQELAQEYEKVTPIYEVVSEKGPDHDKSFEVGVFFNNEHVATGKGKSKQEAEQDAARNALEERGWD